MSIQFCDPSELTYFRKRIGESGIKELFRASVDLHREEVEKETEIVVDTTVQEANVTYPTDVKLRRKILERLWMIGKRAGLKWEFGRKVSIGMTRDGGVIIAAASFEENIYNGDTLWEAIWQAQMIGHQGIKSALVDRGYRGRPEVYGVKILTPETRRKKGTAYQQKKERKRYARRAAVEPVIGHLKSDIRMGPCWVKGAKGASVNVMMAAAAWNINKWILKLLFWLYAYLFAELMHNRQPASKAWLSPQPLPQKAYSASFRTV